MCNLCQAIMGQLMLLPLFGAWKLKRQGWGCKETNTSDVHIWNHVHCHHCHANLFNSCGSQAFSFRPITVPQMQANRDNVAVDHAQRASASSSSHAAVRANLHAMDDKGSRFWSLLVDDFAAGKMHAIKEAWLCCSFVSFFSLFASGLGNQNHLW